MGDATPPTTTLFPIPNLPDCVNQCGPLFNANGACVPPARNAVDNGCFCSFGELQPFYQGVNGVCQAGVCPEADLSSIQSWFTSYCSSATAGGGNGDGNGNTVTTATTDGEPTATGSRGQTQNQGPGGDWISNHWRWVIGIVILVVAIAGIWIGACIWRRRYLKRKERANRFDKHSSQSAFPAPGGSTVHVATPGSGAPPYGGGSNLSGPGSFMPGSGSGYEEKPKKKWRVMERT